MNLIFLLLFIVINHVHAYGIKKNSCPELKTGVHHGVLIWSDDYSSAKVICYENFVRVGSESIYCTALGHWNDTLPECMANDMERFKPCSFERRRFLNDPSYWHCLWVSIHSADYMWTEYTSKDVSVGNDEKLFYLPRYDNTIKSTSGTSLVVVGRSSNNHKRKDGNNETSTSVAKFISPLLHATAPTKEQLCFVFHYYVGRYDPSVILQVRINEKVVWQNDILPHATNIRKFRWTRHVIDLRNETKEFRITLAAEPLRYKPFQELPGIAVDDLRLFLGEQKCGFKTSAADDFSDFDLEPITMVNFTTSTTPRIWTAANKTTPGTNHFDFAPDYYDEYYDYDYDYDKNISVIIASMAVNEENHDGGSTVWQTILFIMFLIGLGILLGIGIIMGGRTYIAKLLRNSSDQNNLLLSEMNVDEDMHAHYNASSEEIFVVGIRSDEQQ